MHCGYVVKVKQLRKHSNADRLQVATFFGCDTIVGLDTKIGDIGVYFPVDLRIGKEYAEKNDLFRRKDEFGNQAGGYLDPEKRNIKALKLRGEKSDGLYMPLSSLSEFTDLSKLKEGDRITALNGLTICEKYIPQRKQASDRKNKANRTQKRHDPIAPLFLEHADTEQLAYNLSVFHPGDLIELTLKMHGTSQRTAYLPVLKGYKQTLMDKIFRRAGKPIYDWGYVTGTRRTVLDGYDGGYYGSNQFREPHSKVFEGKLHKGETVYYEVVGFTTDGTPIMPSCDNKKVDKAVGDKTFTKMYGEKTVFSYACDPHGDPQSDLYVYRMTMTNEDGDVVEYPPDFMRYRCEQMGVKCVKVFDRFIVPDLSDGDFYKTLFDSTGKPVNVESPGDYVRLRAELFYDGQDPVGMTHVREGVVVRIVDRPKFSAYKHKNFSFKVLEGIVKETALAPDMEESQEIVDGVA